MLLTLPTVSGHISCKASSLRPSSLPIPLRFLAQLLLTSLVCVGNVSSFAEDIPDLFLLTTSRSISISGRIQADFNQAALNEMRVGDVSRFRFPGLADQYFVLDRVATHPNGDNSWIGSLVREGNSYRAIITQGAKGAVADIRTPDGDFLYAEDSGRYLINVRESGLERAQACTPIVPIAPAGNIPVTGRGQPRAVTSELTLLVLYTPGFIDTSLAPLTKINQLIAIANQAYIDSGVSIHLKLVGAKLTDYTDSSSNDLALRQLTTGYGPFSGVSELRAQTGADLVALIRPFDHLSQDSCGSAWINGADGQPMDANSGYSVINYGSDNRLYCDSYVLAHELGHNMGSAHDVAHAGTSRGAFSYSHGYGIDGSFGTIMSYIRPRVGKFSSPSLVCGTHEQACGTSTANNVLSLNNTRTAVEQFRNSLSDNFLEGIFVEPQVIAVGSNATIRQISPTSPLGLCTSSNTNVLSVDGEVVTGVGVGSAIVTCRSTAVTVSVYPLKHGLTNSSFMLSETTDDNGRTELKARVRANEEDAGKGANFYYVANITAEGRAGYYVFDGRSWISGLYLFPAFDNWLYSDEYVDAGTVLNRELTANELRRLQADIYIGYKANGENQPLVFGLAKSFR